MYFAQPSFCVFEWCGQSELDICKVQSYEEQRNKLTTVQKERKYPLRIGEGEKTGIALFYGHRTSTIED